MKVLEVANRELVFTVDGVEVYPSTWSKSTQHNAVIQDHTAVWNHICENFQIESNLVFELSLDYAIGSYEFMKVFCQVFFN